MCVQSTFAGIVDSGVLAGINVPLNARAPVGAVAHSVEALDRTGIIRARIRDGGERVEGILEAATIVPLRGLSRVRLAEADNASMACEFLRLVNGANVLPPLRV